MDNKDMLKTGIYEHYKGNRYEVLATAHHSETEELLVVYKALYPTKFGADSVWVRPYDMFVETVQADGKAVRRFQYIGKEE